MWIQAMLVGRGSNRVGSKRITENRMNIIELARIRLAAIDNPCASHSRGEAQTVPPQSGSASPHVHQDFCVRLLQRLLAMCGTAVEPPSTHLHTPVDPQTEEPLSDSAPADTVHNGVKAVWRIAPLPHSRVPAAGIFRTAVAPTATNPGEESGGRREKDGKLEHSELDDSEIGLRHRPALVVRAYAREARSTKVDTDREINRKIKNVEIELERELNFPHSLQKLLRHMRALYPKLEILQPVRRVRVGLPASRGEGSRKPRSNASKQSARATLAKTPSKTSQQKRDSAATEDRPTPHPQKHAPKPRRGAPPLACNVWLEAQLAQLSDPTHVHLLYESWLERYRALRGFYPQEPRRSFRAALAGARQRLAQKNL
jgi:hypothetical protein